MKVKSERKRGHGMKDFREFKVWQKGMTLFDEVVQDVETFSKKKVAKLEMNLFYK
jgi:hypothetical protein